MPLYNQPLCSRGRRECFCTNYISLGTCLLFCVPAELLEEQFVHVGEAVFSELHPDR